MKALIFVFAMILSVSLIGQKSTDKSKKKKKPKIYSKIPTDLDQVKIIVIRYDKFDMSLTPKTQKEKLVYPYLKSINRKGKFDIWNKELEASMEDYPFSYDIINLEEMEAYKEQGYRYVLENSIGINIKREEGKMTSNYRDVVTIAPMGTLMESYQYRFRDLLTGELYYIPKSFNINKQASLPKVLPYLIKHIKKKYKIKK